MVTSCAGWFSPAGAWYDHLAVADVHVGGAVGREHEARVGERILGITEGEDAVVAGEIELLQIDGVGGVDVGIAGAAVEAAAAALEVHHQLGGIAGPHQELVGRAVGAHGVPGRLDGVPSGLEPVQVGDGRQLRRWRGGGLAPGESEQAGHGRGEGGREQ